MKKLALAGVVVSLLTACATTSRLQNSKIDGNVYPVRDVIEGLYINGWESHFELVNAHEFGDTSVEVMYRIEAYDASNPNIVNFNGKKAIKLNVTDTTTMYGAPFVSKVSHFYDVNSHRILGIEGNSLNFIFDTLYPIPDYAHTGQSGILKEGSISGAQEGKVKETWSLTKIDSQLAKLCIISDKNYAILNNIQHWEECYTIDTTGKILSMHETGSLYFAETGKVKKFATVNN